MAAKPIIDMLIEVRSIEAVSQFDEQMKANGYTPKGENGIAGRRYFQKGGNKRTHHVHMYEQGNPAIERHLLFRDYLRAHPNIEKEYAVLKKRLAANILTASISTYKGKMSGSRLQKKMRSGGKRQKQCEWQCCMLQ